MPPASLEIISSSVSSSSYANAVSFKEHCSPIFNAPVESSQLSNKVSHVVCCRRGLCCIVRRFDECIVTINLCHKKFFRFHETNILRACFSAGFTSIVAATLSTIRCGASVMFFSTNRPKVFSFPRLVFSLLITCAIHASLNEFEIGHRVE